MKIVLVSLLLIGAVYGSDEDLQIIDSIVEEPPCLQEGGSCVIALDCPKGQLTPTQGLCPKQQKQGIECCYGVSVKETRCEKHGGSCLEQDKFCNPRIVFYGATNCAKNQKCCILV